MTEHVHAGEWCAACVAHGAAFLDGVATIELLSAEGVTRVRAEATAAAEQRLRAFEKVAARARILASYPLVGAEDARQDLIAALRDVWPPNRSGAPSSASPRQGEPVDGLRDALERREALERLRDLDDKHFPTTRAKRPGWEVCDHDSMTWPCDTQKALDALEVIWPEILEAKLAAALSEPAEAGEPVIQEEK